MTEQDLKILVKEGIYKGKPLGAKLEETHISWILLTNELVFKIKKPVKLSFLDFSGLTTRKALCEKEMRLNKRFLPIYLDVLPVTKQVDGFEIGGESGQIIDYAVVMKRLSAVKKMDTLLAVREITSEDMVALAEKNADLHRNAQVISTAFDANVQMATFNDIESIKLFAARHLTKDYLNIIDNATSTGNAFIITMPAGWQSG